MNSENNFNQDLNGGEGYQPDYQENPDYRADVNENVYSGQQGGFNNGQTDIEQNEQPVMQQEHSESSYQQEPVPQAADYNAPEQVNEGSEPVINEQNTYNSNAQGVPGENSGGFMRNNSYGSTNTYNNYNQHNAFNPYAPNNSRTVNNQQFNPVTTYTNAPNGTPSGGKKNGGMKVAIGIIAACVVVALIVIFVSLGGSSDKPDVSTTVAGAVGSSDAASNATETTGNNVAIATTSAQSEQKDAVWIAEKVRPSVVGVMVYEDGQLAGEGSGVLMSESEGYTYIVTCAHVVDAPGVTYGILLLDGRNFEAELVASDTRTDIAVLKVQQTGLPLAEFGDSSSLKVGETIYAIGNPGGSEYFGSMTDGIVSAIDRSITATYTMTCIQHNAAINPGNSGGALVNSQGQVVGINSSKIASTEYEGMGFAVPTAIAKPVVDALIQYKYVPNRPKLGIEYAPVSSYQLYSMVVSIKGLPKGALVIAGISEDSSLVGTEAEVGDLIIGVNGKDMDDSSVLLDLIDTGAVGDTLTLTLCRIESRTYKTTTFDVTITLVEDKGTSQQEQTTEPEAYDGYYYGGSDSFEDFFNDYFGEFGW